MTGRQNRTARRIVRLSETGNSPPTRSRRCPLPPGSWHRSRPRVGKVLLRTAVKRGTIRISNPTNTNGNEYFSAQIRAPDKVAKPSIVWNDGGWRDGLAVRRFSGVVDCAGSSPLALV